MTKKRALKLIMARGIQRNEAQRLLLYEHEKGATNAAAVVTIIGIYRDADLLYEKMVNAAETFGLSIKVFFDTLSEWQRSVLHEEDPGD